MAGVASLADYDVIIDAGSSARIPRARPSRSTSSCPTARRSSSRATSCSSPRRRCTGPTTTSPPRASRPTWTATARSSSARRSRREHLPGHHARVRQVRARARHRGERLRADDSDAFSALVIMTPTMSEYFEAWKNSRFVSGGDASEQAFVATSRLSDIADILEGLVLTYDGVEPLVAEADPQQAKQTEESLRSCTTSPPTSATRRTAAASTRPRRRTRWARRPRSGPRRSPARSRRRPPSSTSSSRKADAHSGAAEP